MAFEYACFITSDDDIPLAQYGSSNIGK